MKFEKIQNLHLGRYDKITGWIWFNILKTMDAKRSIAVAQDVHIFSNIIYLFPQFDKRKPKW